MRIHIQEINDILTFNRYFDEDGPTRSVDFFITSHTTEVGSFKSSVVPVSGDPFMFRVGEILKEFAVVMVAWDATGEELEANLLVINPIEANNDKRVSS